MDKMIPLSRIDNFFLKTESRAMPMHTASLNIYKIPHDAPADYMQRLFRDLMSFPVSAPPFTYRLAANSQGKPAREVDPSLDLEYHLRHSALPSPGGERELGALISRLHSNQLDLGRPLWEFHLIEGLSTTASPRI